MEATEKKAVIDRIEDNTWAVLLIGQEQTEKIVPVEQLPKEAKAGTWLRLRLEEDKIQEIIVDAEETTALRGRVASKLDKLRGRQRQFEPIQEADAPKSTSDQPNSTLDQLKSTPDKPKRKRKRPIDSDKPEKPVEPQAQLPDQENDPLDVEWYE